MRVTVDDHLGQEAAKVLAGLGWTLADAVQIFLIRTTEEKNLPLIPKVPNTETQAAMREVEEIFQARRARFATAKELFDDLEKKC
jgi:DNA-damage-inducible protein J